MKLKKISLKDKGIWDKYLNLSWHELSVYAFENTYIWRGLFEIYWRVVENSLCIFFKDKFGCFLYTPPLAKKVEPGVIREAFRIMDRFNSHNKELSRIENVEEKDLAFYRSHGYAVTPKFCDYLCQRQDLAHLRGNKFKSQRACFNYFTKHYQLAYQPFSLKDRLDCLKLYNAWMKERKNKIPEPVYQGMLEDSRRCLKILLQDYAGLGLVGRVVKIDGKTQAFTFGFKLNPDTFCILYEITNLSIKGLSQFIFSKICSELLEYQYINIMDDSGLENLKRVKLSYHPTRLIPAYIVKR